MPLKPILFFLLFSFFLSCAPEEAVQEGEESLSLNQALAQKILEKTNDLRAQKGLEALVQDDEMDLLATFHSDNMVKHDFFDHIDHQGKSPSERADDMEYGWSRIAENIAYVPWFENVSGCGDTRNAEALASCVVKGWENSPGHYANIIGDYEELGVGIAFTSDSIAYFTQVFRVR